MYSSRGFTLIELMTVVTIMLILATVWFMSYSSHLVSTRDTNRSAQLVTIYDALNAYQAKARLPSPDDNVEVRATTWVFAYQWYAGENVLNLAWVEWAGKDPKDNVYFTYMVTSDKRFFQVMAFLEDKESQLAVVPQAYATVDYSERTPTVYGSPIWVLVEASDNSPIQEISTIVTAGYLDISFTSNTYIAYLTNSERLVWANTTLPQMLPNTSCLRIIEMWGSRGDGLYKINPTWASEFDVYCDMTTNGWGRTLVHKTTDSTDDLSWIMTDSEGYANWDDDEEYRLDIDLWDDLSTKWAMARNVRVDGVTWDDTADGRITAISTSWVTFTWTDTYNIFDGWVPTAIVSNCASWTYFWEDWSCCTRCVNRDSSATYGSPDSAPALSTSYTSYAGTAVEWAWGTDDANWHKLKKMGIFIR